jgi:hypothetical protein
MADAVHRNAIGGTLQNEIRSSFAFQAVNQINDGYISPQLV